MTTEWLTLVAACLLIGILPLSGCGDDPADAPAPSAEGPQVGSTPMGTLTVRVTETDARPVAGARVTGPRGVWAITGPDGVARLKGLPEADVELELIRPLSPGRLHQRAFAGPVPPDGREVVVIFPERRTLSCTVLSPENEPLPFVEVVVVGEDGEYFYGWCTDRQGRIEVALPDHGPVDLRVTGMRYAERSDEKPVVLPLAGGARRVQPTDEGVVIRTRPVERNRELSVLVLSPETEPLSGVSICAQGEAGRRYELTGDDGRCTMRELPDREVELSAGQFDRSRPWVAPAPVRLVPDGQRITLQVRQGEYVHGVVKNEQGDPIENAVVSISGLAVTQTDAGGRFRLPMLPRSKARLRVHSPYERNARPLEASVEDVVPGDTPIEVVLRPGR